MVAIRCLIVISAIDLKELNLVAVLGLELLNNLVPLGHEFDTPAAMRHEKVDNDELIGAIEFFDLVLEVLVTRGHLALGLFPPVKIHCVNVIC